MLVQKDYTINRMAVFRDKTVEEEYFNDDIAATLTFVRRIVLLCGLMFLLVSIYDIIYYSFDAGHYLHSLISRSVGMVFALLFYFLSPRMKSVKSITALLSLVEASIVLGYIYILYSQHAQGFVEQALTIMLMLFGIFMLPNRWSSLLITGVLTVAGFIFLAPFYIDDLDIFVQVEVAIVLTAALIIASGFFYRDNYNKRRDRKSTRLNSSHT